MRHLFGQINFEKGYFIDNANKRTDCLIKNVDWVNNPTRFDYRINEKSEKETQTITNVKEFGIDKASKFVRANVVMDTSSSVLSSLSHTPIPETKAFTVFLKVLIDGQAALLYYEDIKLKRYFCQLNKDTVAPLFYKKYLTDKNIILESAPFRQYLSKTLKCTTIGFQDIATIAYTERDLMRLFEKYNTCVDPNWAVSKPILTVRKPVFSVKATIALNKSDFIFNYYSRTNTRLDYLGTGLTPNFGIELEYIMPFNKNKWGVVLAPNYFTHKYKHPISDERLTYSSVEIPLNIRYYMFLNPHSKLFVNSGVIADFPLAHTFDDADISISLGYNLGVGYTFHKWAVELRYYTTRDILEYLNLQLDLKKMGLIVSYKF